MSQTSTGSEHLDTPVAAFVTGCSPTGVALLWEVLEQHASVVPYFEPLDGRVVPGSADHRVEVRFSPRLANALSYYPPPAPVQSRFDLRFAVHRLYLEAGAEHTALRDYLRSLLDYAALQGSTAVILSRHLGMRAAWVKSNFPAAALVHVDYPVRKDWLALQPGIGSNSTDNTCVALETLSWARDLCEVFPFLAGASTRHLYQQYYYLRRLDGMIGSHNAGHILRYEELVTEPRKTVSELLKYLGLSQKENLERCLRPLTFYVDRQISGQNSEAASLFEDLESECEEVLKKLGLADTLGRLPIRQIQDLNADYTELQRVAPARQWQLEDSQFAIAKAERDIRQQFHEVEALRRQNEELTRHSREVEARADRRLYRIHQLEAQVRERNFDVSTTLRSIERILAQQVGFLPGAVNGDSGAGNAVRARTEEHNQSEDLPEPRSLQASTPEEEEDLHEYRVAAIERLELLQRYERDVEFITRQLEEKESVIAELNHAAEERLRIIEEQQRALATLQNEADLRTLATEQLEQKLLERDRGVPIEFIRRWLKHLIGR
jgi:hypothetical protein